MKKFYLLCVCSVFMAMSLSPAMAQKKKSPKFKVIVLA